MKRSSRNNLSFWELISAPGATHAGVALAGNGGRIPISSFLKPTARLGR